MKVPFKKLLQDRVLCREIEKNVTASGIIVAAPPEENIECEVLQVGEGKYDDFGRRVPMSVKPGDKILVNQHQKQRIRIEDQDYIVLNDEHIRAVLE